MDHRGQKQHYAVDFPSWDRKAKAYSLGRASFSMRPIQLRFLLNGLLWKQGSRTEADQVGPVSYLDNSNIRLSCARYFACCYMKDTLLLFITSFEHKCSTPQRILQSSTFIKFVKWLRAQELPLMVCRCFMYTAQMEEPRWPGSRSSGYYKGNFGGWVTWCKK